MSTYYELENGSYWHMVISTEINIVLQALFSVFLEANILSQPWPYLLEMLLPSLTFQKSMSFPHLAKGGLCLSLAEDCLR